ncbi:glycosyltransferase family 8 protein [Olivibacter sp. CPCC 100613]|uniref:glycosyltransferase family 8 protein n=1 Tax=Olivibacter sp. CPCC 100613 TaxID=3079931 RepID=UPI002FFBA287
MTRVPVVFCFDDNLILPAGVCLHSLLSHADPETFYDIFILHGSDSNFPDSGFLERLHEQYDHFSLTYRNVGNSFSGAFEIRNITSVTYYRLLIPELIPEYDKVMYHDVDVIFRGDLRKIFEATELGSDYIAGVITPSYGDVEFTNYLTKLNLNVADYVMAGNMIMNIDLMRKQKATAVFRKMVGESTYKYQDMDILNIYCKGKIKRLPPAFCGTIEIFEFASNAIQQSLYSAQELHDVLSEGIIHYNGAKPWNSWCPNLDIWWAYYRGSVFYDPKFYFDFFNHKLTEYDRLPLSKRIKILFRYFKTRL